MKKIRVLIVDDSVLMREAIKSILESVDLFEVVGIARDGQEAVQKASMLKPDVITMDLKMPLLSGLDAIEQIMETNPIPIIVVSSMDKEVVIKTLATGAMDFISVTQDINELSEELIEKVKIASRVRPLKRMKFECPKVKKEASHKSACQVIGIGVSTGGPQALQQILMHMPSNFPAGIIVVQHISSGFIDGLAEWLNSCSHLQVKVAVSGDVLKSGIVLLAPDNYNTAIDEDFRVILKEDSSKKLTHVPSADVMLKSIADSFKQNSVGVLLTGMGRDGVEGMQAIKKAGGTTIAQDEKTSVIFGMNKVAIETGCIDRVVGLDKIPEELCQIVGGV